MNEESKVRFRGRLAFFAFVLFLQIGDNCQHLANWVMLKEATVSVAAPVMVIRLEEDSRKAIGASVSKIACAVTVWGVSVAVFATARTVLAIFCRFTCKAKVVFTATAAGILIT